jgi:hypothetical protein
VSWWGFTPIRARGNSTPVSTTEEQRDAVDAEVPGDAERLDPGVLRGLLEPRLVDDELGHQVEAHRAGDERHADADEAAELGPAAGGQGEHERPDRRDHDEGGEDRELGRLGVRLGREQDGADRAHQMPVRTMK